MIPDLTVITFLPPGKLAIEKPGEKVNLFKMFECIIKFEKLEIDNVQFHSMISSDLEIDLSKFDKRLLAVLGEAFVYYLTAWPGWKKSKEYISGQLGITEWYERFRQYLIFKSNYVIRCAAEFDERANKDTAEKMVETNITVPVNVEDVKTAPYILSINGPPLALNNIAFMESNGNIVVKQHVATPLPKLSIKELLNWPCVSVEVKLIDLTLSRTNIHESERYIAIGKEQSTPPKIAHILYAKKISDDSEHKLNPYSYRFIYLYMKQFVSAIKTIPGIRRDRVKELDAIFAEYLEDIREANYHNGSVCTNTMVGYHIGENHYVRNKRMGSTNKDGTSISFNEIIIPRMEYALHKFDADQDMATKSKVSFQSLNRLLRLSSKNANDKEIQDFKFLINDICIGYRCTFCNETFSGPRAQCSLKSHFNGKHQDEQPVLCLRCGQQIHIKGLAANRWKHTCVVPKGTNAVPKNKK